MADSNRVEIAVGVRDEGSAELDRFAASLRAALEKTASQSQTAASQVDKLGESVSRLPGQAQPAGDAVSRAMSMITTGAEMAAAALGLIKLAEAAKEAVDAAAKYEMLGVTMTAVGTQAGYTQGALDAIEATLRAGGLSMINSRQAALNLMAAHVDLSNATDLVSVAQDAAAITGTSVAETLEKISTAAATGQTRVLRSAHIYADFDSAAKSLAAQLGKTTDELTQQEKVQSRVNAIIQAGTGIQGAYEAASGTAARQQMSLNRYLSDFQVELGKAFGPALSAMVGASADTMKYFTEAAKAPLTQGVLSGISSGIVLVVTHLDVLAAALATGAAAWVAYKVETTAANVAASAANMGFTVLERGIFALYEGVYALYPKVQALWALLAAHPLAVITAAIGVLVVAYLALTESVSESIKKTAEAERKAMEAGRAYEQVATQATRYEQAMDQLNKGLAAAAGDQAKERDVVEELVRVYPELATQYRDTSGNVALFTSRVQALTAAQSAERELKLQEALDKQRDAYDRISGSIEKMEAVTRGSTGSLMDAIYWIFNFDSAISIANLSQRDANETAKQWLKDLAALEKMKGVPGVPPEALAQYSDAQDRIKALLEQMTSMGVVSEDVKTKIENLFAAMAAGAKKAADGARAVNDRMLEAWSAGLDAALKYADAATEKTKSTTAAQIAAIELELAAGTASAAERARLETGLSALKKKLAEDNAAAAAKSAKDAAEAEKKSVAEIVKAWDSAAAADERRYKQGVISELELIATLEGELSALARLQSRQEAGTQAYEDLGKRRAETEGKIQSAIEARYKREQELDAARVSFMADGLAKDLASFDLRASEEEKNLSKRLAAQVAYWNATGVGEEEIASRLTALWDAFTGWYTREKQKQVDKAVDAEQEIYQKAAELAGDARKAKEIELARYITALKNSGLSEQAQAQATANKITELYKTEFQKTLDAWKDTTKLMDEANSSFLTDVRSGFKDWVEDIGNEEFKTFEDAWDGLLDAMKKALIKWLAEMATIWAASALADLLKGLSGGTIKIDLSSPAGAMGSIGSIGSLASTGSTLYKLGAGIAEYFGITSATPTTMSLQGAADVGALGSDFAAINEGIGVTIKPAAETLSLAGENLIGVTEGLDAAAESLALAGESAAGSGAGAAGAAGAGAAAYLGPLAFVVAAAMGIYSATQENDMKSTPEYARMEMGLETQYYSRLSSSSEYKSLATNNGSQGYGSTMRGEVESEIAYMTAIAERAGVSQEAVDGLILGIDALKERMAAAAAVGDDELAASIQHQIDVTQAAATAYGFSTTGLGEYGATIQKVTAVLADVDAAVTNNTYTITDWVDSVHSGNQSLADLSAFILSLGSDFNLSSDQATDFASRLADGSISADQFRAEMDRLATSFVEAGGVVKDTAASVAGFTATLSDNNDDVYKSVEGYEDLTGMLTEVIGGVNALGESVAGLPSNKDIVITTQYQTLGSPPPEIGGAGFGGGGNAMAGGYLWYDETGGHYHTGGLITMHAGGFLSGVQAAGMITAHGGAYLGLTSDEVLVKALRGEYVMRREAVDYYGTSLMDALNSRSLPVSSSGGGASSSAEGATSGTLNLNLTVSVKGATSNDAAVAAQIGSAIEPAVIATLERMADTGIQVGVAHKRGRLC